MDSLSGSGRGRPWSSGGRTQVHTAPRTCACCLCTPPYPTCTPTHCPLHLHTCMPHAHLHPAQQTHTPDTPGLATFSQDSSPTCLWRVPCPQPARSTQPEAVLPGWDPPPETLVFRILAHACGRRLFSWVTMKCQDGINNTCKYDLVRPSGVKF